MQRLSREEETRVITIQILESWLEEDQEECERLGLVSKRSAKPNVSELYRRMRELWYSTPQKIRDKITVEID